LIEAVIWVDFVILGIIALSAVISLFRGFIKEAFSLVVWIAAFWLSWTFFRELAEYLIQWVSLPSARLGISFALIMIAVLIVGGIINFLLSQLVEHSGLSGTDRILGIFFGIGRGVVIVAIIILLAGLTAMPLDPWWDESVLIAYFQEISVWLKDFLPDDIASHFSY
jgi:membrane protein required for colicin V production